MPMPKRVRNVSSSTYSSSIIGSVVVTGGVVVMGAGGASASTSASISGSTSRSSASSSSVSTSTSTSTSGSSVFISSGVVVVVSGVVVMSSSSSVTVPGDVCAIASAGAKVSAASPVANKNERENLAMDPPPANAS